MNITEWRKSPEHRSLALEMLNQPTMQQMLAVLQGEDHPARQFRSLRDGFDATIAIGEIRGYQEFLNNLVSMTKEISISQEDLPVKWSDHSVPIQQR